MRTQRPYATRASRSARYFASLSKSSTFTHAGRSRSDPRAGCLIPCSPPTEDAQNPLEAPGCGRLRLLPDERCPLCSASLPLWIAIDTQRGAHILDQALVLVSAAHLGELRGVAKTSCLRQQSSAELPTSRSRARTCPAHWDHSSWSEATRSSAVCTIVPHDLIAPATNRFMPSPRTSRRRRRSSRRSVAIATMPR